MSPMDQYGHRSATLKVEKKHVFRASALHYALPQKLIHDLNSSSLLRGGTIKSDRQTEGNPKCLYRNHRGLLTQQLWVIR